MKIALHLFTIAMLLSVHLLAQGQQRSLQHRPYADQQLFHLGFTVGIHTQDLILTQSGYQSGNGEVWFSEIPDYTPGFTVGIVGDLHLSRYLNLRMIPSLNLGSKELLFREQETGEEYNEILRNNYITMPVHLKLAGIRINNYKPFFILGGYGSIELARKKTGLFCLNRSTTVWRLGPDVALSTLFTLSPELKFSWIDRFIERERDDLKEEDLMKYTLSLTKATQRMITSAFISNSIFP